MATSPLEVLKLSATTFGVQSGPNNYIIRYRGAADADPEYVALWDCSCPARTICKHIKAVSVFCDEQSQ